MRLTTGEREQYERNGYLVRRNVFSVHEIAGMGSAIERVCAQLVARKDRRGKKTQVSSFSVFEEFWAESVVIKWEPSDPNRLPGFVEPMRDLVGCEDVALFTEKLNLKRAHGGGGFAPHRDFPYWDQHAGQPELLVTAWVALDDADAENGALEVLPGSHLLTTVPTRKAEKLLESFEVDSERFDTSEMCAVPARTGDVIFFGPILVHRSGTNQSSRDRRALLYTYQPAGLHTQLDNMHRWADASRRNA